MKKGFGIAAIILCLIVQSCGEYSKKMEGEILKDSKGKYFRLTGDRVLGDERYRLIEVDTASLRKF